MVRARVPFNSAFAALAHVFARIQWAKRQATSLMAKLFHSRNELQYGCTRRSEAATHPFYREGGPFILSAGNKICTSFRFRKGKGRSNPPAASGTHFVLALARNQMATMTAWRLQSWNAPPA